MNKCERCFSYAINPHCHGREAGVDLDLCDVCYWRKRAETTNDKADLAEAVEHDLRVKIAGGRPVELRPLTQQEIDSCIERAKGGVKS